MNELREMFGQREEHMRDSAGHAARRRDLMLAQTRKLSLQVAAAAAAASIVLGAAFARELPGHHAVSAGTQPGSAQHGAVRPGSAPARQPSAHPTRQRAASQHLAQPSQAPATAPPAPAPQTQVTSGGS